MSSLNKNTEFVPNGPSEGNGRKPATSSEALPVPQRGLCPPPKGGVGKKGVGASFASSATSSSSRNNSGASAQQPRSKGDKGVEAGYAGSAKQEVVSITYEEIGLFPRSFSRVLDRFLKQVFSDVENLVIQEYRFYRYLFLTTLKCLLILFFIPFFVNLIAKTYIVRPLTEFFWNTKQTEIFLNSYQQKHAFAELKEFEEKTYFESLIFPKSVFVSNITTPFSINVAPTAPTLPSEGRTKPPSPLGEGSNPDTPLFSFGTAGPPRRGKEPDGGTVGSSVRFLPPSGRAGGNQTPDVTSLLTPPLSPVPKGAFAPPPYSEGVRRLGGAGRGVASPARAPGTSPLRGSNLVSFGDRGQGGGKKGGGGGGFAQDGLNKVAGVFEQRALPQRNNTTQSAREGEKTNNSNKVLPLNNFSDELNLVSSNSIQNLPSSEARAFLKNPASVPLLSLPLGTSCNPGLFGYFSPSDSHSDLALAKQPLLIHPFLPPPEGPSAPKGEKGKGKEGGFGEGGVKREQNPCANQKQGARAPKGVIQGSPKEGGGAGGLSPVPASKPSEGGSEALPVPPPLESPAAKQPPLASDSDSDSDLHRGFAERSNQWGQGTEVRGKKGVEARFANQRGQGTGEKGQAGGVGANAASSAYLTESNMKSSLFVYQTQEADKNIQQRYQEKTIEIAQRYNDQSMEAITNIFADLISLLTLFYLLYALEIQINITKSFLLEVFFGLDDSKKSLLILLITDLLVGYHSSNLWELFFEFLFHHYGLPESQTGIFLLVATLPVLLDVLFKYLIFRHLNRSSPATVATYHAMIE